MSGVDLVGDQSPIQLISCVACLLPCCHNLHRHHCVHSCEVTQGDIEISHDDAGLVHPRDEGDEPCPQCRVGLTLHPFSTFEVRSDHDEAEVVEAPNDCVPSAPINDLMLRIVKMEVGREDDHESPICAPFATFSRSLPQSSKTSSADPLHGFEAVSLIQMCFNYENWCSWSPINPLSNFMPQSCDIGESKVDPLQDWMALASISSKPCPMLQSGIMRDGPDVRKIEGKAMVPNQWMVALVALLPKSAEIERPIALVATLYRLWCRLRSNYTKEWQSQLEDKYPWERAVPGAECLQVALKRAFITERNQAMKKAVILVLLDVSNFYDRINLQKLAERWLVSNYPGTHAAFAMQIYCGTRILEAGEASNPMWTENGIVAGDPQALLAAKIYLQKAFKTFCKKYLHLHTDLWIDDLSFDVIDRDAANAVRIALQAYDYIKELLEEGNAGPVVHDVTRDLGVDCTAGRLRRI